VSGVPAASVSGHRPQVLALGINLGWLQQGAGFGGRQLQELTADLERIRNYAGQAGYAGYDTTIDTALTKLTTGQPPASVNPEARALIERFQRGASGKAAQALSLGIILGWLQQGARAGNRTLEAVLADLRRLRDHARLAGYEGGEAQLESIDEKLNRREAIGNLLPDVTALISHYQGQQ
jgi:hypothetical protein